MKWLLILLGLVYVLLPLDAIPDLIAGLGWLDDLLLAGVIWYLLFRRPDLFSQADKGTGPQDEGEQKDDRHRHDGQASGRAPGSSGDGPEDPYQVLGVAHSAGPEEIRAAYRRLAAQYHPDKVAHLGDEFQRLAEQKFKAIQAAYDHLQPRT